MLALIVRRCLSSIPLLFLLSIVSFAIIKAIPGDPVEVLLGSAQKDIAPQQLVEMRKELGLDQPLAKQYVSWLNRAALHGDFGRSYRDGRPALEVITERLPATLVLVGTAMLISFAVGIGWGLFMVWVRGSAAGKVIDGTMTSFALMIYAAPSFWLGFIAIACVSSSGFLSGVPLLGYHPPGEPVDLADVAAYVILPALVLSSRRTAKIALFVRASIIEELSKEYASFAFSKGLSRAGVLLRHVMKNSLLPIVSLVGLSLPALLGGSVLVETVFAWPGMGRLAVDATFGRNYPVILALIMTYGAMVIFSNLMADIAQLIVDPRAQLNDLNDHNQLVRRHA